MDNSLNSDTAANIARNANSIVQFQRQIDDAMDLIKALGSLPEGEANITVSTFFRQQDYPCTISNASAICLLRESIEIKQQQIKQVSEYLRSVLQEPQSST